MVLVLVLGRGHTNWHLHSQARWFRSTIEMLTRQTNCRDSTFKKENGIQNDFEHVGVRVTWANAHISRAIIASNRSATYDERGLIELGDWKDMSAIPEINCQHFQCSRTWGLEEHQGILPWSSSAQCSTFNVLGFPNSWLHEYTSAEWYQMSVVCVPMTLNWEYFNVRCKETSHDI